MHPVVVTGGAAGLGRLVAETILSRGRRVLLVDRDEPAMSAALAALQAVFGDRADASVADLTSLGDVHALAQRIRGPVGGLVNNAGGWLPGEQYPQAPAERWLSALTLNLVTPMLLTQLLWQQLADGEGAVVNVCSSGGLGSAPYASPEYGAAKAGLRRFTSSLGSRADVRVTAVVPGWIGLDRAVAERSAMTPDQRREAGPLIPPHRVARVIADLVEQGRPGQVVDLLDDSAPRGV